MGFEDAVASLGRDLGIDLAVEDARRRIGGELVSDDGILCRGHQWHGEQKES